MQEEKNPKPPASKSLLHPSSFSPLPWINDKKRKKEEFRTKVKKRRRSLNQKKVEGAEEEELEKKKKKIQKGESFQEYSFHLWKGWCHCVHVHNTWNISISTSTSLNFFSKLLLFFFASSLNFLPLRSHGCHQFALLRPDMISPLLRSLRLDRRCHNTCQD